MSSGAYTRRVCPACGTKGRLTGCEVYFVVPGKISDPMPIDGSRCGKCKAEIAYGQIVRRGREKPGPAENEARRIVVRTEIRRRESAIESAHRDIADLNDLLKALTET